LTPLRYVFFLPCLQGMTRSSRSQFLPLPACTGPIRWQLHEQIPLTYLLESVSVGSAFKLLYQVTCRVPDLDHHLYSARALDLHRCCGLAPCHDHVPALPLDPAFAAPARAPVEPVVAGAAEPLAVVYAPELPEQSADVEGNAPEPAGAGCSSGVQPVVPAGQVRVFPALPAD